MYFVDFPYAFSITEHLENQFKDCLLLITTNVFSQENWVLLSALLQSVKFLENKNISSMKMLKSKGLSMGPCGTPDAIFLHIL